MGQLIALMQKVATNNLQSSQQLQTSNTGGDKPLQERKGSKRQWQAAER